MVQGSCVGVPLRALSIGFSKITLSLNDVRTTITVAAFKPLTRISPSDLDKVVVLAVGSSKQVVFEGGPRPWILKPSSYFRNLVLHNETVASAVIDDISDAKTSDFHVFTVLCRQIGETVVSLRVGNKKSVGLNMPYIAEAGVRVVCAIPTVMELKPLIHRPRDRNMTCNLEVHRIAAQCYRDIEIAVIMRDHLGRMFDNFTSLAVNWQSSDTNLATITKETTLLTVVKTFDGYTILEQCYQILHTKGMEGIVKISATVKSYHHSILQANDIFISTTIDSEIISNAYLDLVEDAQFNNGAISVFNHPQNMVSLSVLKGSGQFDFEPKDQVFATVAFNEQSHEFKIIPKSDGSFTLVLYDICLEARVRASIVVRISGIQKVQVIMVDKVGLNKEIKASVKVLDQEGTHLPTTVFDLLDVRPEPASGIIAVRPLLETADAKSAFRFVVTGKLLGHTTLTFRVFQKLSVDVIQRIPLKSSDPHPIQVFSPLRLHPKNITLIIGAVYQIINTGGPHPKANIEYSIEDTNIAQVNSAGIVEGLKIGTSVISARAVGIDSENGNKVVYSQDQIQVYVVALTGIRIHLPLTRVQAGTTIPVYAVGINEQEIPFAFGSSNPPLIFKWFISNKEVASLEPVYQKCGMRLLDTNHFMMRLKGKQQGQVTLSLKVSISSSLCCGLFQIQDDETLVDEVQIQIFEKLRLVAPPIDAQDIIITPNSQIKLISNKDHSSVISYRMSESSCSKGEAITIDNNGNLHSGQSICHASLLITASDEIGANQTISALISVKPVSYLMVSAACSLRTKNEMSLLPVGSKSLFYAEFHDNVGRVFHATSAKLKFLPNRHDLIQLVPGSLNNTFYVKANNPGLTVLRVYDAENPGVQDFVLIVTGEAITPSNALLTLGDRLCFQSPLTSAEEGNGRWFSENPNVIHLNADLGLGVAADVGSSLVVYNISESVVTNTEVTVMPVTGVKFQQPLTSGNQVNNVQPAKSFRFPLNLESAAATQSQRSSENCPPILPVDFRYPLPYQCLLRFSENVIDEPISSIFDVKENFDFDHGYHECIIQAKQLPVSLLQRLSTLRTNLELSVIVPERPRQTLVASDPLPLTFVPAFYVHNTDLHVGDMQPTAANVIISANEQVFSQLTVHSNDTTLVRVLPPETKPNIVNTKFFPVKLSDQFWQRAAESNGDSLLAVKVDVSCSLTGQVLSLPVTFKIFGDKLSKRFDGEASGWRGLIAAVAGSYQTVLMMILALLATPIVMFLGYQATLGRKYYAAGPDSGVYLNRIGAGEGRIYPAGSPGFGYTPPPAERPHLWSVNEPVHGSPSFNRTPSPRFRNGY